MTTNVVFEIAKLLKDKGYDIYQPKQYNGANNHLYTYTEAQCKLFITLYYAPTIADVIMWLYEKHGIWINIGGDIDYKFKFEIHTWSWYELEKCNRLGHTVLGDSLWDTSSMPYDSPTEAYLEAIKYCLTKLI